MEEEYEPQDGVQPEVPEDDDRELNDMAYFMELLKYLRDVIDQGKSVPLTKLRMVNADMCLRIITNMEQNLPDAVQYGSQVYSEQGRILDTAEQRAANMMSSAELRATAALDKAKDEAEQQLSDARAEAEAIIADAEERAAHLVSDSVVMQEAREEARIMRSEARIEVNEMRLQAIHDTKALLADAETELSEALAAVRRRRGELESQEDDRI